ncbi:hypothetical protein GF402_11700 [Candidatus Fermentibacteria bacterium]|nr:hypothetical protein [Candidatus Fermentibacteria bacterium]
MGRLGLFLVILIGPVPALAAGSAGPDQARPVADSFEAVDSPNDAGGVIELSWAMSPGSKLVDSMLVTRSKAGGPENVLSVVSPVSTSYRDTTVANGVRYSYALVPMLDGRRLAEVGPVAASASAQWIHSGRSGMLIITVILAAFILYFIRHGRKGGELYIRQIAGLSAVDDAVGRATEMGRPVLYIPGIMDMDNIQTIASTVILGRVAARTAEYGTPLMVPVSKSVVLSVAQEVVKEAYLEAGRPDAFQKDSISYLTDDQFGYAAGVDGIIVREKPAAIFLLGAFYAESLILAETGRSVGAIQIAGTAMPSQLPFFIAACDYTLIGEELFAASAYLSREPKLLGSLKGQDVAKLFFMVVIVLGVIASTVGQAWDPASEIAAFIRNLTHVE